MLNWNVSPNDADLIHAIAIRASDMAKEAGSHYAQMDAEMDITACHLNGCSLRLAELAVAENFDFAHDVFGIRRNINRESGKLGGCFSPRFSV